MRTVSSANGLVDVAAYQAMLSPDAGPHLVSTAAVAVENTHNFGGGSVQPYEALVELSQLCHSVGVGMHLDGARLWNAHVASGVPLGVYGSLFDTVSVCFSKGLGAPGGSLLAGPKALIAAADRHRRRLGGAMRQNGIFSAAASSTVTS